MAQRKLTKRQQKFVEEMANPNTKSKAEAARNAGYSIKRARMTGRENVTKSYIFPLIEQRKKEAAVFAKVSRENIIGATAQRAYASIDDAFDEDGHFSMEKARATGAVHLIKSITRTANRFGESVKVEFYSKADAQDKLGNYLGLEKQPDENPTTLERNKDAAERVLAAIMEREGIDREAAIARYVAVKPEVKEWLN